MPRLLEPKRKVKALMALQAGRVSSVHLALMTQAKSSNPGCREHSSTRFAFVVMLIFLI